MRFIIWRHSTSVSSIISEQGLPGYLADNYHRFDLWPLVNTSCLGWMSTFTTPQFTTSPGTSSPMSVPQTTWWRRPVTCGSSTERCWSGRGQHQCFPQQQHKLQQQWQQQWQQRATSIPTDHLLEMLSPPPPPIEPLCKKPFCWNELLIHTLSVKEEKHIINIIWSQIIYFLHFTNIE